MRFTGAVTSAADLVIVNARVCTQDASRPSSDAVAVRDGAIVALGADDVRALRGSRTEVVDAGGGLVLPGFQDAHVHPPFGGRQQLTVDLHGAHGRAEYLERTRQFASGHPEASWITGGGWSIEHFPGGLPHRSELDAVVPSRPVFLFNRDLHGAWVNSEALRRAGITRDTPDPPDGRIERDPVSGDPTGMLHEGAAYSFEKRFVPPPDIDGWAAAILAGQAHLHSLGVTAWQDAWVTPEIFEAYQRLAVEGLLTARVVGAQWWEREQGLEQIAGFVERRSSAANGVFRATTVKIMVDGVLENRTGALLDPYLGGCCGGHDRGLTYVPQEVLEPAVVELDRLGFQIHLHTIGDRAVRNALDAIEAARAANGTSDHRHHLAHVQIVQPSDVPRFAALGVTANCQAYWAVSEPQMDEHTVPIIGPARAALQYPFATLEAAGATLAMGSDWPVTTADPLRQIEVAMTRTSPDHRGGEPFLPGQALSLAAAIRAFTVGSAHVNHDPSGGVLAIGNRADLVVLDRDLFAPDAPLPSDATVTHTIASGRVVHSRSTRSS